MQANFPGHQEIGEFYGQITVITEFETIEIGLKFKVDYGSLEVITDPVKFNNCFPVSNTTDKYGQ